jgi:hypothetical protein
VPTIRLVAIAGVVSTAGFVLVLAALRAAAVADRQSDEGLPPVGVVAPPSGVGVAPSPAVDELVGLSEKAASEVSASMGLVMRIVERDGDAFPATMDFRDDRVNVVVVDGRVTAATVG